MSRTREKTIKKILFRWKLVYRSVGKKYTLRPWEDNDTIERFEFLITTKGGWGSSEVKCFPEDGPALFRITRRRDTLPSSAVYVRLRRQSELPDGMNLYTNSGKGLSLKFTIISGRSGGWETL